MDIAPYMLREKHNGEDISTKMKVQPATMGIKATKLVAWAISQWPVEINPPSSDPLWYEDLPPTYLLVILVFFYSNFGV